MTLLKWGWMILSAGVALVGAPQPGLPVCQLILDQEQFERDELDLDLRLTLSEVQAAERIFTLLDSLWKKEAIERLVYLRGKHDRDAAAIDHDRARHRLERQDAAIEQLRLACRALSGGKNDAAAPRAEEEALERYRRANCDLLASGLERAEVDVTFLEEVLLSVRELRANDVATEQDVIRAERDVEMARKTLEQARRRAGSCREKRPEEDPSE